MTISECAADENGWMQASGTITNNSSKASDYSVEIVMESPDGSQQFETTYANAQGLEPGQSKPFDAPTLQEAPGEFTCRVAEVNRFASN